MWYNEAFLAPFFLEHFKYIDNIHIIMDADTNDNSREIARRYPNVTIEEFKFPDMMDDIIKVEKLNSVLHASSNYDWVIVLDGDELVFDGENPSFLHLLKQVPGNNVVVVSMWQVYRNTKDKDLDSKILPIHTQRRYGDPDRFISGVNGAYNKPVIIRGSIASQVNLNLGNHSITGPANIGNFKVDGAHWAMADLGFAIERRIEGRKKRQSKRNLQLGLTFQHHHITKEQLEAECNAHLNDPKLF